MIEKLFKDSKINLLESALGCENRMCSTDTRNSENYREHKTGDEKTYGCKSGRDDTNEKKLQQQPCQSRQ